MSGNPLEDLPLGSLLALADSLRTGPLASGMPQSALAGITGPERAQELGVYLQELKAEGFTPPLLARLVETVAAARSRWPDPGQLFSLVFPVPKCPAPLSSIRPQPCRR